jgi:hypothetical protein
MDPGSIQSQGGLARADTLMRIGSKASCAGWNILQATHEHSTYLLIRVM